MSVGGRKMLVYPDRAFYHKLDGILSQLRIAQTNNPNDRYHYSIYFSMNTSNECADDVMKSQSPIINGGILPTSKAVVEDVFVNVFGYSSFVRCGRCLKKPLNHASKKMFEILDNPDFEDGFVYQRLMAEKSLKEYRCTIIRGEIILCWERGINELCSFKNDLNGYYSYCESVHAQNIFSENEILLIEKFSNKFRIDFADLDIMRDDDGVLYILDVNPTASYNIIYNKPNELKILAEKFREMLECMYNG